MAYVNTSPKVSNCISNLTLKDFLIFLEFLWILTVIIKDLATDRNFSENQLIFSQSASFITKYVIN